MNIGFDAKRYFNNSTGLGNYARWLIDGLHPDKSLNLTLFHQKSQESTYSIATPTGINSLIPSLWRSRFITSDLERKGINVYHGLSNELPFGIHKTKIKSIVTIHDLINKRYPENYSKIDGYIYDKKVNYAQMHANHIVVPSVQTKKDLMHYYKTDSERISVLPLSTRPVLLGKKSECKPYIFCVSSYDKRKNIVRLIQGFNTLNRNDIQLIIAGKKGEVFEEAQELAKQNSQISLKPNVSNQELADLYTNSLFCCYPSLFEGFGIPILEAYQYGKTIATSNVSSMPEVGGNAAEYFDPMNIDSIVHSLANLLDSEYRKSKEIKIPNQLNKFDSNALIAQYTALYKHL